MLWLLVFLAVAMAIQARQVAGVTTARRVDILVQERTALESERAELERGIRLQSSRKVLGAKAEVDLGLHFPQYSELTLLPLRPRRR